MTITQDVSNGKLHSAFIGDKGVSFEKGREFLEQEGYRIISLEEQARLRIQEGSEAAISRYGNWVKEGVIYVPKKGIFLTKKSPIMNNSIKKENAPRKDGSFYLTAEQVKLALTDSVKITETEIPVSDFASNELTKYAFGKYAKSYGGLLKQNGVESMPITLAAPEDKPFIVQLWLRSVRPDAKSELLGNGSFPKHERSRGVKDF